mmetsp:Transcript_7647/g.19665  ORF Transcript_7647/g.19665 Transcript_7647/m.19665 type:complete len:222 (+) Transcript_7647:450-1115(+)
MRSVRPHVIPLLTLAPPCRSSCSLGSGHGGAVGGALRGATDAARGVAAVLGRPAAAAAAAAGGGARRRRGAVCVPRLPPPLPDGDGADDVRGGEGAARAVPRRRPRAARGGERQARGALRAAVRLPAPAGGHLPARPGPARALCAARRGAQPPPLLASAQARRLQVLAADGRSRASERGGRGVSASGRRAAVAAGRVAGHRGTTWPKGAERRGSGSGQSGL